MSSPGAKSVSIGDEVLVKNMPGVVRFVGHTQFAPGVWVGVELSQPTGKNDGSINGIRYFQCEKPGKYGLFASPAIVVARQASVAAETSQHTQQVVAKLQAKLQDAIAQIKTYKEQIEILQKQVLESQEFESRLEQLNVDRDYVSEQNTRLQASLASLQAQHDAVVLELASAQEELELNRELENEISLASPDSSDLQSLAQANRRLQLALANARGVHESRELELSAEIDKLQKQLADGIKPEDYSRVLSKLARAEESITELQQRLESVHDLDQIVDRLATENELLNQQLKHLQTQVDEMLALQELGRNTEEVHSEIEGELRRNIDELHRQLLRQTQAAESLETEKRLLENQLANLASKATDQAAEVLRLEVDAKSRELAYCRLVLEACRAQIGVLTATDLDPKSEFYFHLSTIKPLIDAVGILMEKASFAEQIKLRQVLAAVEYLYEVGSNNAVFDKLSTDGVRVLIQRLYDSFQDLTISEFPVASIEETVLEIHAKNTLRCVLNLDYVSFMRFETRVFGAVFHLLVLESGDEIARIRALVDSVGGKLENAKFDLEVDSTYKILLKPLLVQVLKQYFGNYELDLEEKLLLLELHDVLAQVSTRFAHYAAELERPFVLVPIETVPEPVESTENKLKEKEKTISDLELTIQLLESNMSSLTASQKKKVDTISQQLQDIKSQYDDLKQSHSQLEEQNRVLGLEMEELLSSGKYFSLKYLQGKFDSVEKEQQFVDTIKILEEVNYLRSLVVKPAADDLSWLETPKTKKYKAPELYNVSNRLQKIARSSRVLPLSRGVWKPKSENPRFVVEAINEQMHKYERERTRVLAKFTNKVD